MDRALTLSPSQAHVLEVFRPGEKMTLHEMAARTGLRRQTCHDAAMKLVRKKLLANTPESERRAGGAVWFWRA